MRSKLLFILAILVLTPSVAFLLGVIISTLWNWLIPTLFYLPEITILQALGLYVLVNILFSRVAAKKFIKKSITPN